jgi:hypothetical protein
MEPLAFVAVTRHHPQLWCMRPQTLADNISRTAKLLDVPLTEVVRLMAKKPQLLAYRPETTLAHVTGGAAVFRVEPKVFTAAALSNVHLLTMLPDGIRAKIPLIVAIARELGLTYTPADTLRHCSIAYVYGLTRLAFRLDLAKSGVGPRKLLPLLMLADKKARALAA